ncbi:MAG TPA: hypothetical protein VGO90_12355 [Chthoniobacteraceae bacterium]|jgi:hypothetical protein|nr:hypothetical protein [Chthoniobacter sp.]HEV7868468.1 hypothetical protein [Chthoniobacteraceae bacterium]
MGILKPFSRAPKPMRPERLPNGCFTLHRGGDLVASTLPSSFSQESMLEIGRVVLEIFDKALSNNLPLTDLHIHYSGLVITARELRGGALVFLQPATLQLPHQHNPPAMHYKNLDEFVLHLENYIECWKQFNHYVNLARDKKFSRDDETQFLEVKSIIAQGLEAILASTDKGGPKKEEVHQLFANAPSLRYLADMSDVIPTVESNWHKVYLGLQSLLGQLKVQQNKAEKGSGWSLFGRK